VNPTRAISGLLALFLASCAGDSGSQPTGASQASTLKPLSERLGENNGFKQDADGNWVPRSDKRSSYESAGPPAMFQGEYQKKTYKTGEYAKKSWWGNKDYGRKEYAGNTDGSRFQTNSRFDGQGAREAGNQADIPDPYQTGTYATNAARETGNEAIGRPSDAETDIRRRVYTPPSVIDWREQRSLSLEQSKGILGR
jgi:hypothetical protein